MRYGEVALRAFHPPGVSLWTWTQALPTVNNYSFGFLHREIAWEQLRERSGLNEEQWRARLQDYLEEAAEQDRSVAEQMVERFGLVSRESFEFGLDRLLDGIAGHVLRRS